MRTRFLHLNMATVLLAVVSASPILAGSPAAAPRDLPGNSAGATKPTIALIGATSRSGREIIRQALAQGYQVKGLARTPAKLALQHDGLQLFAGDVRDQASLEAVLSGAEVVVSMVGYSTPADPTAEIGPVDLYTVMARNLIGAMQAKGNRRLVMASSTGVEHRVPLDSERPATADLSAAWRWNARRLYHDMAEMERLIEGSGLDYIILRPGFLTQAPARHDLKIARDGRTPPARVVTYADFAAFIVANLTAAEHLNETVGLYSDTAMNPQAELDKVLGRQTAAVALAHSAVFADCPTCPEMVVIPPGTFIMGHDGGVNEERYEGPPHQVSIDYSFAFGRLEVTTAQFREFVAASGYQAGTDCRMWTGETVEAVAGKDWRDPGYGRPPLDNEPVACVSWYDAKAYVGWLAEQTGQPYRLPTEAEWEYVAHGGQQTEYSWGDDPDAGCAMANYYDQSAAGQRPWEPVACNDGHRIVAPVGSLAPNAFGVHDITGNVWEWVEDCYQVPYGAQPTDGRPYLVESKCEKRGVRGGAWHSRATWQRPTFRGRDTEDFVTQVFGIRVVRNLP